MPSLPDAPYAPSAALSGAAATVGAWALDFVPAWAHAPDPVKTAGTVLLVAAVTYAGGWLARSRDKQKIPSAQSTGGPQSSANIPPAATS
jgi:hypothetical protein